MKTIVALIFLSMSSLNAQNLGSIQAGGSGCPEGTLSSAWSPDNKSISMIFDAYSVTTGGNVSVAHQSCAIAIPIQILPNQQMKFIRGDYRGFNNLPNGTESRFSIEYFLAGEKTTPYVRVFEGPLSGDYLLQDAVDVSQVKWSDCGTPVTFRINSDISVYRHNATEDPMLTLDTLDISTLDPNLASHMSFYFVFQSCEKATSSAASSNPLSNRLAGAIGLVLLYICFGAF